MSIQYRCDNILIKGKNCQKNVNINDIHFLNFSALPLYFVVYFCWSIFTVNVCSVMDWVFLRSNFYQLCDLVSWSAWLERRSSRRTHLIWHGLRHGGGCCDECCMTVNRAWQLLHRLNHWPTNEIPSSPVCQSTPAVKSLIISLI